MKNRRRRREKQGEGKDVKETYCGMTVIMVGGLVGVELDWG